VPVFQKNAHLVGGLWSGTRLAADEANIVRANRADVVFSHTDIIVLHGTQITDQVTVNYSTLAQCAAAGQV